MRRRTFVRRNSRYLGAFGLLVAVELACLAVSFMESSPLGALLAGVSITVIVVTAVAMFFVESPPSLAMRLGNYAERRTGRELRKHRLVAATASTVEFDRVDVDHVIVTGLAVVAVEVKYCSTRPSEDRFARDLAQLQESVRKTRLLLTSKGIRDLPVHGLLVYWGTCPDVTQNGAVTLDPMTTALHVNDLGSWLDKQDGELIDSGRAAQVVAAVEHYAQLRANTVQAEALAARA